LDIWTAVPQVRSFIGGLLQGARNAPPVDSQELFLGLFSAIGRACDLAERAEIGHSERIASLGAYTAGAVGLDDSEISCAYLAGLLHDTGMTGIPDSVLTKPAPLSRPDMSEIWGHPAVSFANSVLLTTPGLKRRRRRSRKSVPVPKEIPEVMFPSLPWVVRWHHERPDGSGYPDLITGKEMPTTARIVSLCDAYVSMTEDRPYRRKMSKERAAERVLSQAAPADGEIGRIIVSGKAKPKPKSLKTMFPAGEPTQETITNLVCCFAAIADAKHKSRQGHSQRLATLASHVARSLSLAPADEQKAFLAGLLCDVGMLCVLSTKIDSKQSIPKGRKSDLSMHPVVTKRILSAIPGFDEVADIALSHHESFDGSGYPQGIYGHQIPSLSQMLSICDSFAALTADRPHRSALGVLDAEREMKKDTGKRHDSKLLGELMKILKRAPESLAA
jgi:HD-GYP domain-containing protein (c-di-GMP phosphodiesterase class II)